ncbi:MAG: tetratricopeptide repeat protein [Chthoniobacterales bacterium]
MAQRSGKMDDLIESLKEKQAKEKGGARYGKYLAEIYLQLNDYQSAREELQKSLGKSPDDPAAVDKLLSVARREGNQEEVLRLSERLAELEPSKENRAAYIRQLIVTGRIEDGIALLEASRKEIAEAPQEWFEVLLALRNSGRSEVFITFMESLRSQTEEPDAAGKLAIAKLLLASREYKAAASMLRDIIIDIDFKKSIEALTSGPASTVPSPRRAYYAHGLAWLNQRFAPLVNIGNSIENFLNTVFLPPQMHYGGRSSSYAFSGPISFQSSSGNENQKAQLEALYLYFKLSKFENMLGVDNEEAIKRIVDASISPFEKIFILLWLNRPDEVPNLINTYINSPGSQHPGESAALLSIIPSLQSLIEEEKMDFDSLSDRLLALEEQLDPEAAYNVRFQNLFREIHTMKQTGVEPDEKFTKRFQELLATSKTLPASRSNQIDMQLFQMASLLGLEDEAAALLEERLAVMEKQGSSNSGTQWVFMSINLSSMYLNKGDFSSARKWFLRGIELNQKLLASSAGGRAFSRRSIYSTRGFSQFDQVPMDIADGSPVLPFGTFSNYINNANTAGKKEDLREFIKTKELPDDVQKMASFYMDWRWGDRDLALKKLAENFPPDESDAAYVPLLFGYEITKQYDKALELAEVIPLLPTESKESREIRKIRLTRLAGNSKKAAEMVEKISKRRLPQQFQYLLINETNALGINSQNILTQPRRGRPANSSAENFQKLVREYKQAKDNEKLKQIAMPVLLQAFPNSQNYAQKNLRQISLGALYDAKLLASYEDSLNAQLQKKPDDPEVLLRLAELRLLNNESRESGGELIIDALRAGITDPSLASYAIELALNRDQKENLLELYCDVLAKDPSHPLITYFPINQVANLEDGNKSLLRLAKIVASLNESQMQAFIMPFAFSTFANVPAIFQNMAALLREEKNLEAAIRLLDTSIHYFPNQQFNWNYLSSVTDLAEMQLEAGKKDAAASTLLSLISSSRGNTPLVYGRIYGENNLALLISNMLQQSFHGQFNPEEELSNFLKIAKEVGVQDDILAAVESDQGYQQVAALYLRTLLDEKGVDELWKKYLGQEAFPNFSFQNAGILLPLIKAVGNRPYAKDIIPLFIKKDIIFPHPDWGLSYLAVVTPILKKNLSEKKMRPYLETLVDSVLSSNNLNNTQRFLYSSNYSKALRVLLDLGYTDAAFRLFDSTEDVRNSNATNVSHEMLEIATRIDALRGKGGSNSVALFVTGENSTKATIAWQATEFLFDKRNSSNNVLNWSNTPIPFRKEVQPHTLQLYAGRSIGDLKKIASRRVSGSGGVLEGIELPGQFGVVQARWKNNAGNNFAGIPAPYVFGKNLFDAKKFSSSQKDLKKANDTETFFGLPIYKMNLKFLSSTLNFRLLETDFEQDVVYLFKINTSSSMPLGSDFSMYLEKNNKDRSRRYNLSDSEGSYSGWNLHFSVSDNNWGNSFKNISKGTKHFALILQARSRSSMMNQHTFSGEVSGISLIAIDKKLFSGQAVEPIFDQVRKILADGDSEKAVELLRQAMRLAPDKVTRQQSALLLKTFEKSKKENELLEIFSNPIFYYPNPLNGDRAVMDNDTLLDGLIQVALRENTKKAREWLDSVVHLLNSESIRFVVKAALLKSRADEISKEEMAKEAAALFGYDTEKPKAEILQVLWNKQNSSKSAVEIIDLVQK